MLLVKTKKREKTILIQPVLYFPKDNIKMP